MGMLDRVKGITPYANSGRLKPRVGAKADTHTVRDDSGNTTGAMTERRTKRESLLERLHDAAPPHRNFAEFASGKTRSIGFAIRTATHWAVVRSPLRPRPRLRLSLIQESWAHGYF